MPNSVSSASAAQVLGSSGQLALALRQTGQEQKSRPRFLGDLGRLGFGRFTDIFLQIVHLGELADDASLQFDSQLDQQALHRRARSSLDLDRCLSASIWSSEAGLAAVRARSPSADRIEPLARIKSFWSDTPASPRRADPPRANRPSPDSSTGPSRTARIRDEQSPLPRVDSHRQAVELVLFSNLFLVAGDGRQVGFPGL